MSQHPRLKIAFCIRTFPKQFSFSLPHVCITASFMPLISINVEPTSQWTPRSRSPYASLLHHLSPLHALMVLWHLWSPQKVWMPRAVLPRWLSPLALRRTEQSFVPPFRLPVPLLLLHARHHHHHHRRRRMYTKQWNEFIAEKRRILNLMKTSPGGWWGTSIEKQDVQEETLITWIPDVNEEPWKPTTIHDKTWNIAASIIKVVVLQCHETNSTWKEKSTMVHAIWHTIVTLWYYTNRGGRRGIQSSQIFSIVWYKRTDFNEFWFGVCNFWYVTLSHGRRITTLDLRAPSCVQLEQHCFRWLWRILFWSRGILFWQQQ